MTATKLLQICSVARLGTRLLRYGGARAGRPNFTSTAAQHLTFIPDHERTSTVLGAVPLIMYSLHNNQITFVSDNGSKHFASAYFAP